MLAFESRAFSFQLFKICDSLNCVRVCIMTAFSIFMFRKSSFEIVGYASIKTAVLTFENIYKPHNSNIAPQLRLGFGAVFDNFKFF